MAVAVAEVDAEADRKPDHESNPGEHAQVEHEPDVGERDEDRDPWIAGDFEDSLQIGALLAHDRNRDGNKGECRQCADVHHVGKDADVAAGCDECHEHADGNLQTYWSAVLACVTERARQQAVPAHGEHHAGQAEQQHHDHGGQTDHNAKTDDFGGPVSADHFECCGERRVFLLGEVFVGDHAGGDDGDEGVEHDDQSHAHADAQRNVLLRVDGFLGGGGDHIEAEEREEHEGRAGNDAGDAVDAGGHAGDPLP